MKCSSGRTTLSRHTFILIPHRANCARSKWPPILVSIRVKFSCSIIEKWKERSFLIGC